MIGLPDTEQPDKNENTSNSPGEMKILETQKQHLLLEPDFDWATLRFPASNSTKRLRESMQQELTSMLSDDYHPDRVRDRRQIGKDIIAFAAEYLISRDDRFLQKTYELANHLLDLEIWGISQIPERTDDVDLMAAHSGMGLAIVGDWLSQDEKLDEALKLKIVQKLHHHAELIFQAIVGPLEKRIFWSRTYQQNHHWHVCGGLAVMAAFLRKHGKIDTTTYSSEVDRQFQMVFQALPDDGVSYEGQSYWAYGCESLIRYLELKRLEGVDLYHSSPWIESSAYWVDWMLTSDNHHTVGFGDSPPYGTLTHDCAPLLNRIAKFTSDNPSLHQISHRFLQLEREEEGLPIGKRSWPWRLIWFNPEVEEAPSPEAMSFAFFEDQHQLFARTHASGLKIDLAAKAGPPMGFKALRNGDTYSHGWYGPEDYSDKELMNPDHAHAESGHFVLHLNGQEILGDIGYGDGQFEGIDDKRIGVSAEYHNLLLINKSGPPVPGHRKYGWVNCFFKEDSISIANERLIAKADLAGTYPSGAKLKSYERTWEFSKEELCVIDTIQASTSRRLDWYFQFRIRPEITEESAVIQGEGFKLTLKWPDELSYQAVKTVESKRQPHCIKRAYRLHLRHKAQEGAFKFVFKIEKT